MKHKDATACKTCICNFLPWYQQSVFLYLPHGNPSQGPRIAVAPVCPTSPATKSQKLRSRIRRARRRRLWQHNNNKTQNPKKTFRRISYLSYPSLVQFCNCCSRKPSLLASNFAILRNCYYTQWPFSLYKCKKLHALSKSPQRTSGGGGEGKAREDRRRRRRLSDQISLMAPLRELTSG